LLGSDPADVIASECSFASASTADEPALRQR
jgi:hypothetical protein